MPLKVILQDFCSHVGLNINDVSQRAFAVNIINQAAEDLYSSHDPAGSLREQLFTFDNSAALNSRQLTLPFYVEQIRAIRQFNAGLKIQLHDMRPRFSQGGWHEQFGPEYLTWRFKGYVPLERDIINEGTLNVVLPSPNDLVFNLSITGGNSSRSRFVETLAIPIVIITLSTVITFSADSID